MKKILNIIICAMPMALTAQVDRTKAPKPGPAPVIKVGTPASFTLPNGLKIFVVQNNKLPRVSATLTLDYEPILEGDKAGYTSMAGSLMSRGTTTKTKEVLDEEVDFLGADLNVSSSNARINSLTNNFTKAFAILADVVLHPSFPKDEMEKIRKQTLSSLETQKDEPASITNKVVSRLMYGKNHPYGDVETEATIKKITLDDIKKFYSTYWKPNGAYLVFVGDITAEKAKALATQYFAGWQKGVLPKPVYATPTPTGKTFIAIVDRPAAVQSVITLTAPIQLKPGSDDDIAAKVMNSVLGESATARLFMNLREKHSFTYGAYSSINTDKLIGSFKADASVRNEKTDSAIQEFLNEFAKIKKEAVPDEEIGMIKNYMNGSFARSLERPSTIANFALNIARYHLPKDYYQTYLTKLASVNSAKVQQVANKYVQPDNLYIVIVGNAKEVAKGLDKYGEIKYFDVNGNEVKAPSNKAVDPSITGESIIKKCLDAYGTKTALDAVKDASLTGSAELMGQSFEVKQQYIIPGSFLSTFGKGAMVMMKQLAKGDTYSQSQMGQELPLEDGDKEELKEESYLFSENYYLQTAGYSFTVKGIESVDGKDAYVVEIKTAKDRTFSNYYDVESGLKVKTSKMEEGEPGKKVMVTTTFSDYQTYNNVKLPTKMLVDQGPMKINIAIKDVKLNTGLKAEDFK